VVSLLALGGLLGCALGLLSKSGGSRPAPGLRQFRPLEVISRSEPLASAAAEAGVPGMPMGQDDDDTYTALAPSVSNKKYYVAPTGPLMPTLPPLTTAMPTMLPTCCDNEEMHMGLCYKKCSLLTNNSFPYRTSAFNCCKDASVLMCLLPSEEDLSDSLVPGTGYDVDGHGSIPHPAGKCFDDEEDFLGTCYKTCSLLTFGEYPLRAAASTCCKEQPCYNIFNLKSSGGVCSGYDVGR